jgi:hypothetical protein
MTDDYEPFGIEWEKEMNKMPKKVLILTLKAKLIEIIELEGRIKYFEGVLKNGWIEGSFEDNN